MLPVVRFLFAVSGTWLFFVTIVSTLLWFTNGIDAAHSSFSDFGYTWYTLAALVTFVICSLVLVTSQKKRMKQVNSWIPAEQSASLN
jgi:hypothetical protein